MSDDSDVFCILKVYVVGILSIKSSVLTVTTVFCNKLKSAYLPLIVSIGVIITVAVEPTSTDSLFK